MAPAGREIWRVGFTPFAGRVLGELVEFSFEVKPGDSIAVGQLIGRYEGFKSLTDIYAVAAGLPAGVLNLIAGDGSVVGEEFVVNPQFRAISFTGATPVGRSIHEKAAVTLARTQLEMGGKNPAVVLADADLDLAAEAVVRAGFACAGQWCTSTSRALVETSVMATFQEKVRERVAQMRVGPGTDPAATMVPVCGEAQLRDVLRYIEIGRSEGATLLAGGQQIAGPAASSRRRCLATSPRRCGFPARRFSVPCSA